MVENESLLKGHTFPIPLEYPRLRLKPVTVAFLAAKLLDVITTWIAIQVFGGWEVGLATALFGFKQAIVINVVAVVFGVTVLQTINFKTRLVWAGPIFTALFPLWNTFVIGCELLY
ncbi:MAG: hypothetical protein AB1374_02060 [Bacillota bacterium]